MDARKLLALINKKVAIPWYLSGGILPANCVAAYQAKGASSYVSSLINIANPGTYNAVEGIAPTFDASYGWAFTGTQWLNSQVVPSVNSSFVIKFSEASSGVYVMFGSYGSPTYYRIFPNRSNNVYYGVTAISPGVTNGVLGASITAATAIGYRNGISEGTVNMVKSGISSYIGAQNENGTGASAFFIGKIQAIAIYSVELSPAQFLALATIMSRL